jgi:hypothetical protein
LHGRIFGFHGGVSQAESGAAGQGDGDDEQGFKVLQDVHFVLLVLVKVSFDVVTVSKAYASCDGIATRRNFCGPKCILAR